MTDSKVADRSKLFAIRIIKLYKYLVDEKREYVLSKQILKSGTSIGANAREAVRGQSTADFYAKMNVSLKEAEETAYWLELLHETDYLNDTQFDSIYPDCQELIKMLVAVTKKQKIKAEAKNSKKITPHSELRTPN